MSRWELAFFGLTLKSKVDFILESFFLLTYYCGFTYQDVRLMSIAERTWFVNRLIDEFKKSNEKAEQNNTTPLSRASHANDPTVRQMAGLSRDNPPARGRRFT
mgnify:CR=1 FL=1